LLKIKAFNSVNFTQIRSQTDSGRSGCWTFLGVWDAAGTSPMILQSSSSSSSIFGALASTEDELAIAIIIIVAMSFFWLTLDDVDGVGEEAAREPEELENIF
jgi:hypothetical protein